MDGKVSRWIWGIRAFISKPVLKGDIAKAIRKVLEP